MKKILIVFLMSCLILTIPTGCDRGEETTTQVSEQEEREKNLREVAENVKEIDDEGQIFQQEESGPDYFFCPFCGIPLTEEKSSRALMVSIENSPAARPQAGLAEADIVYEFLVEGGITRFLALYWREIPDKIGPIRSLRPFLIETALDYKAYLLHSGASPDGFSLLEEKGVLHLDQIYNGDYYWRDNERRAPHNLYTGYFKIEEKLQELSDVNYDTRFTFQHISLIGSGLERAGEIKIDYWGNYDVYYRYDAEKNVYKRYLYSFDEPHQNEKGEQITARNIIIQFVDTMIKDKVGRLDMELSGKNKALVFRDGVVIEGYWQRQEGRWANYYNQTGDEIKLNRGRTWIQVVPLSAEISY